MKVTYSSGVLKSKCRIIASMQPGRWYQRGQFASRINHGGNPWDLLVKAGFMEKRKLPNNSYLYEYKLTADGVVLCSQLKSIGVE